MIGVKQTRVLGEQRQHQAHQPTDEQQQGELAAGALEAHSRNHHPRILLASAAGALSSLPLRSIVTTRDNWVVLRIKAHGARSPGAARATEGVRVNPGRVALGFDDVVQGSGRGACCYVVDRYARDPIAECFQSYRIVPIPFFTVLSVYVRITVGWVI